MFQQVDIPELQKAKFIGKAEEAIERNKIEDVL